MQKEELKKIIGGATDYMSGNFINSFVRILNIFLELGRNIGSALNYNKNRRSC